MEKKEFQKAVKEKFKAKGFKARGNHYYKIIDDKYLIGASLIHRTYNKAYYVDYGIIYLPDETKLPFKGNFDWSKSFWFTKDYEKKLNRYQLDHVEECYHELTYYFEYDVRSMESLEESMDVNIEKMLCVLSDEKCALKDYPNRMNRFVTLSEHEIKKFIRLGAVSKETVLEHRIRCGYKDNSFLDELEDIE